MERIRPRKNKAQSKLLLACNKSVLKASYHEFKAFKDWILLSQEESEKPPRLHPLGISLLKYFHHLFPEEIPSGLPPKRDIEHHIDLIPGAILANKLAYKMNSKDTMEIQRQVED